MGRFFACVKILLISLCGLAVCTPWQRAHDLLQKMTFDEKILMVHGSPGAYVGDVPANTRLNIPALHLEDGPQGVADGIEKETCWPSALTVVATWDVDLMHEFGKALAKEQRAKGTNIMLGPMVNIARVPMGGRNFESFGEDPHLSAKMAHHNIKGVQSQKIMATVKHFADNNQEHDRTLVSANVDERTQWEIYYPAFQAAIDAGVGAVMCSYNRINDTYACENQQTLNNDLKQTMGFTGFVMSDWGATHSTVKAANSGLDMQMPDATFFGNALVQAIKNGTVNESRLDDMVMRILLPMFAVGLFDDPVTGNLSVDVRSKEHSELARKLATHANVLLKNDGNILPLNSRYRTIAVIGDDASANPIYSGGGSGHVIASNLVTPLQAIQAYANKSHTITYATTSNVQHAVLNAKSADIAVIFVGTTSHEGKDRANLSLADGQDQLIAAVAQAQPKTVVVVHTPGAVVMPWIDAVAGVICAFLPGEEDGNAIVPVLFGDHNPSGKLPLTFPVTEAQIPVNTPQQYPGINEESSYSEKLLVGYRWYDARNVTPLFPFGHGLSYTSFQYSNLQVSGTIKNGIDISVDVHNSGQYDGAEVVQLYLGYPSTAGEPPKVLRGFKKVHVAVGNTKTVTFRLTNRDVVIWDVTKHAWKIIQGNFNIYIGSSSRDIRVTGKINV